MERRLFLVLPALLLFAGTSPAWAAPNSANGQSLYEAYCAECHTSNPRRNSRGILVASNNPAAISSAISSVSAMSFMRGVFATSDLEDIAAFIGTPAGVPLNDLDVPSGVSFGVQSVGTESAPQAVVLSNPSSSTVTLQGFTNTNPAEFPIVNSTCSGALAPGVSCQFDVTFRPAAAGQRSSTLNVLSTADFSPQPIVVTGIGEAAPGGGGAGPALAVVEYFNAKLDHYFISSLAADIEALDSGRLPGWVRTGRTFRAYASAATAPANASPVCRFYIPPALGDSHFYSASPDECASVRSKFPAFSYESPNVMYIALPNPVTGACPGATLPVWRLWNARADSNHRYTTDAATRAQMISRGYLAEGYGPDGVAMCSP